MKKYLIMLLPLLFFIGCEEDNDSSNNDSTTVDITDKELTNRSEKCEDYVGTYTSSVQDVKNSTNFEGELVISVSNGKCVFNSNSIPNHDFQDGSANFFTVPSEVNETLETTTSPTNASTTTALSLSLDNAVMLNGVKLDLLAAACYGVGPDPLGQEKIGCGDEYIGNAWRYDPMSSLNEFGTDTHNAHTQPDGAYHYHGNPNALFDMTDPTEESPVIGFAADGYPIYGSYISDNGTIRKVESSYTLKTGSRVALGTEANGDFPGGDYDGQYREDYEYVQGHGDLDECNGMTHNGAYGYYITDSFPWVLTCFKGTTDTSFNKGPQ